MKISEMTIAEFLEYLMPRTQQSNVEEDSPFLRMVQTPVAAAMQLIHAGYDPYVVLGWAVRWGMLLEADGAILEEYHESDGT